jgi:hyaluronoglucosaminidase
MAVSNVSQATYISEVLADGPRGYWRFGESLITDPALDTANAVGFPQEGAQTGDYDAFAPPDGVPTVGVAGIPGGGGDTAANFAPNSQVLISDPFDPTAYTWEAWVKPETIQAQSIVARTAGNPTTSWSHQLRMTASGAFEAYTYDGAAKSVIGATIAQPDTWYHVVGTAANGGQMRLFVNGVEEGTPASINTLWTGGDQYRVAALSGNGMGWFDGVVDELALYPQVLSSERIGVHYTQGSIPEPSTLFLMLGLLGFRLFRRRN